MFFVISYNRWESARPGANKYLFDKSGRRSAKGALRVAQNEQMVVDSQGNEHLVQDARAEWEAVSREIPQSFRQLHQEGGVEPVGAGRAGAAAQQYRQPLGRNLEESSRQVLLF